MPDMLTTTTDTEGVSGKDHDAWLYENIQSFVQKR